MEQEVQVTPDSGKCSSLSPLGDFVSLDAPADSASLPICKRMRADFVIGGRGVDSVVVERRKDFWCGQRPIDRVHQVSTSELDVHK